MRFEHKLYNTFYRLIGHRGNYWLHKYHHMAGIRAWADQDVVFLHIPKAAGTSINAAFDLPDLGHLTYKQLLQQDYRYRRKTAYVAIIRDPMSRLVSAYNYALRFSEKNGKSTLHWIARYKNVDHFINAIYENSVYKKHYFFLPSVKFFEGINQPLYVVDFDRLNGALTVLSSEIGKSIVLENKNRSSDNPTELSARSKEKVKVMYERDYELRAQLAECEHGVLCPTSL